MPSSVQCLSARSTNGGQDRGALWTCLENPTGRGALSKASENSSSSTFTSWTSATKGRPSDFSLGGEDFVKCQAMKRGDHYQPASRPSNEWEHSGVAFWCIVTPARLSSLFALSPWKLRDDVVSKSSLERLVFASWISRVASDCLLLHIRIAFGVRVRFFFHCFFVYFHVALGACTRRDQKISSFQNVPEQVNAGHKLNTSCEETQRRRTILWPSAWKTVKKQSEGGDWKLVEIEKAEEGHRSAIEEEKTRGWHTFSWCW